MPGYQHVIEAAARHLRATVNALPVGPQKDAIREASEGLIAALAGAHFTLRDGHELPPVSDPALEDAAA
jgi:hypothetical protein